MTVTLREFLKCSFVILLLSGCNGESERIKKEISFDLEKSYNFKEFRQELISLKKQEVTKFIFKVTAESTSECKNLYQLLETLNIVDNRSQSLDIAGKEIYILFNDFGSSKEKLAIDLNKMTFEAFKDSLKGYNSINLSQGNIFLLNLSDKESKDYSQANGIP